MKNKLNIKIKPLGLLDLLAFKNLVPNRKKIFSKASAKPINEIPPMNALAMQLHPKKQVFTIENIIDTTHDMKIFVLSSNSPAYFRAGQYVSLKIDIDGYKVTRPYSILSSPNDSLNGTYSLGIKKTESGFVSEYIFNNWKKGDSVETSGPEGTFYYEGIRDANTVIGIAGGCGITPFYSMAKAIAQGTEDFNLYILYGCKTNEDIALKAEFDQIVKTSNGKVKIVYILSDEKTTDYEHGFITKDIIEKYSPKDIFSIFICGPQVMYTFIEKEIAKLNLAKKFIRRELFGQNNNIADYKGFPKIQNGKKHKLVINIDGKSIETTALSTESVLVAIERAKLQAPSKCRTGECGFCRSRLLSGDVFIPVDTDGRRASDKKFGYIHPCASFPISDLEIEVPLSKL